MAERVSAWVDGEADAAEADALLAALKSDPALRDAWSMHHVVGDALRSSDVACCHSAALCARIGAALADEPTVLLPRARAARRGVQRWMVPAAGVAAATAFLALGVPRVLTPDSGTGTVMALSGNRASAPAAAPSVVAGAAGPRVVTLGEFERNPRLEAYLQAHRGLDESGVMPSAAHFLRVEDTR